MRADRRIRRPGSSACRTRVPMCPTRSEGLLGPEVAVVPTRLTTVSRAASRATVKPARSGSQPGSVSTAVTMTERRAW